MLCRQVRSCLEKLGCTFGERKSYLNNIIKINNILCNLILKVNKLHTLLNLKNIIIFHVILTSFKCLFWNGMVYIGDIFTTTYLVCKYIKTELFLVDFIQAGKCPTTSFPKTNNYWLWSHYKLLSMDVMSFSFFFLPFFCSFSLSLSKTQLQETCELNCICLT